MRNDAWNVNVDQEAVFMMDTLRKLWKDEEGLSTVEYALLLVLIVIVGITAWQTLGASVNGKVLEVNDTIAAAS